MSKITAGYIVIGIDMLFTGSTDKKSVSFSKDQGTHWACTDHNNQLQKMGLLKAMMKLCFLNKFHTPFIGLRDEMLILIHLDKYYKDSDFQSQRDIEVIWFFVRILQDYLT